MARIHAKSVLHLVDEFDFSGVSNQATLDFPNSLSDVTSFADADHTFVEGKGSFSFNIQGLLDAAGGYDAEMFTDLTTTARQVGVYPGGGAAGNYGYEGETIIGEQSRVTEISAALALNVTWKGVSPAVRAVLLGVNTAVGATASGTKYQRGAAAAGDTIVGVLRLLAAPGGSGNNTMTVTVESDANASAGSETTRLTFTQLTQSSVALSEVKTAAGAVTDTYWRVVFTYAGAGSRTFNLLVGFGIRPT